jgi:hypothetical protein
MGTQANHREKAEHNERFLKAIDAKEFPDWKVTVCFYKALHLVEMLFAITSEHSVNHRDRHDKMKRGYVHLWKEYLPLYTQSRRARYQTRTITDQTIKYVEGRLAELERLIRSSMP